MKRIAIIVYSTLIFFSTEMISQSNCSMLTGVNPYFNEYWSGEFPFSNLMMQSQFKWNVLDRDWPEIDEWSSTLYHDSLVKDPNGYPIGIPQYFRSQDESQTTRTWLILDAKGPFPKGIYTVLYDGEGTIDIIGSFIRRFIENRPGFIQFEVDYTSFDQGGLGLEILRSDKLNHVRNIRVLLPNTSESDATYPFNPAFINQIKPFSCVRFLNWPGINNSKDSLWVDRKNPNYFNQSSTGDGGLAWEHMIKLCNFTKKDMWLCIPHKATEDYVYQLALLMKGSLRKESKIYLEYSNEVWNDIFDQHHWVRDNSPYSNAPFAHKYAYLANRAFKQFMRGMGSDSNRVVRVIAGQHYNPWIAGEAIAHVKELGGRVDAVSCASYFAPSNPTGQLSVTQIASMTKQEIQARAKPFIIDHKEIAVFYGIQLLMYESGPHMTRDQWGQNPPFEQALCEFHTSAQMGEIYRDWLKFLRDTAGVKLHNILGLQDDLCTFGHISDTWATTPTVKLQAVLDFACSEPVSNSEIETRNEDFSLYPNPSSGVLNLNFLIVPSRVEILDVFGNIWYSEQVSSNNVKVDMRNLPTGMYIVRAKLGGRLLVKKFLKI